MSKVGIFMADGCEEIEGLTVVDIVRRAKLEIETISITEKAEVTSSHQVTFKTDTTKAQADFDSYDAIVLPGGMPGTLNLGADEIVVKTIKSFATEGKLVAAICAAPSALGENHILEGKEATGHPGFEEKLLGAQWLEQPVVVDGNVITSRGMGTDIAFSLEIVRYFTDDATVEHIRQGLVY